MVYKVETSGRARLKYWGGPPKQILIHKSNIQIIMYTKNLSCNKYKLDHRKMKLRDLK
jgi:hypothetical protein